MKKQVKKKDDDDDDESWGLSQTCASDRAFAPACVESVLGATGPTANKNNHNNTQKKKPMDQNVIILRLRARNSSTKALDLGTTAIFLFV